MVTMHEANEDNVDAVQRFYKTLNSNNIKGIKEQLTIDAEFTFPLSLPYGGVWRGFDRIIESLAFASAYLGNTSFNVTNYLSDNGFVICTGFLSLEAFSIMFLDVFSVGDRRISSRKHFIDTALLLETFSIHYL